MPEFLETRHPPNAAAAAILSMIVPGAGQLYAGRPLSAIGWFVLVTMGYLLLIVPGVVLHVLCVASAAGAAYHWRPTMA
jgi:TM2 domain-containing membrane protein YozV